MPRYRVKPGGFLVLPGRGHLAAGYVVSGDDLERYCPAFLERLEDEEVSKVVLLTEVPEQVPGQVLTEESEAKAKAKAKKAK